MVKMLSYMFRVVRTSLCICLSLTMRVFFSITIVHQKPFLLWYGINLQLAKLHLYFCYYRCKSHDIPICLMYGKEDPWVRPIWGLQVKKQLPEAPYYLISPAGHCPHDEVPEVCYFFCAHIHFLVASIYYGFKFIISAKNYLRKLLVSVILCTTGHVHIDQKATRVVNFIFFLFSSFVDRLMRLAVEVAND